MNYKFQPDLQLSLIMFKLSSPVERQMIAALQEDPEDKQTRNEYADYLLDQGFDPALAEQIRNTLFVPGGLTLYWGEGTPMKGTIYSGSIAFSHFGPPNKIQITSGAIG